jgi:hypothetical protein
MDYNQNMHGFFGKGPHHDQFFELKCHMDLLVQHLSNLDGSYLIDWMLPSSNWNQNN